MALQGNGQLLIKVRAQPFVSLFAVSPAVSLPGFALEPLSHVPQRMPGFSALAPADHWMLAKPATPGPDNTPWDTAHAAAKVVNYAHYVEPDILHVRSTPPVGTLDGGLKDHWPPNVAANDGISPGWHLGDGFTDFVTAWRTTTGAGVRIAHLDTGYTPMHDSKPRHLRPELGYDYWAGKSDPVDPGAQFLGILQPGHGTATLALLAGNAMDMTFGKQRYVGDVGGAPDAEVIPVRIGPSVIHFYTSTMAQGLYHALAPGDPTSAVPPNRPDPGNPCLVVSISHGGLPSQKWADAVNTLYEAGIVIVAASGDSIDLEVMDIATRYTVYPSAFNRVLTAVGATYAKQPYIASHFGDLQGCWGPDAVMEKAAAAYTPNVVWMKYDDPPGFEMNGGGTSASTPQIAAACALWLQRYGAELPADWRRVEACRLALFTGTDNNHSDESELGRGLLNAPKMLDKSQSEKIITKVMAGALSQSPADSVSFPFWRLLFGEGPPGSDQERMYETEVAQVVLQSQNQELRKAAREAAEGRAFSKEDRANYAGMLAGERISDALRARLNQGQPGGRP